MTQRNPLNERYTTDEKIGKTRKSAASAKPVSKAASSVRVEGSSSNQSTGLLGRANAKANKNANKNAEKKASKEERLRYYDVPTDEYKKWRRIWWITIIVALVATAVSFFLQTRGENFLRISAVLLFAGYAFLIAAIIIDFAKVRKIRKEYQYVMTSSRSKEVTAMRKAQKKAEREAIAEAEAEAAAKQAAKEAAAEDDAASAKASRAAFRAGVAGMFKKRADSDTTNTEISETSPESDDSSEQAK